MTTLVYILNRMFIGFKAFLWCRPSPSIAKLKQNNYLSVTAACNELIKELVSFITDEIFGMIDSGINLHD